MPKNGFCPECHQTVHRFGMRRGKVRYNIIPVHMKGNIACFGSGMPWSKAIARHEHIKIDIVEIGREL